MVINGFLFFALTIVVVYTGELLWKDISSNFASILDSSPVSDRNIVLSKFSALIIVEFLLIIIMALIGIVFQISKEFYDFQLTIYMKILMLRIFPAMFFLTILSFLIHTLVNNKFLGHTIIVLLFLFKIISSNLDINHILIKYGKSPYELYSGMNGYNKFVFPVLAIDFYWLMFGIILLTVCILLAKRGINYTWENRFQNFKLGWKYGKAKHTIILSFILFVMSGSGIYYSTNKLNTYRTKKQERLFRVNYEKEFSKFQNTLQPSIVDVKVQVDIFPADYAFIVKGKYLISNKTATSIDTIHLRLNPTVKFSNIQFDHGSKSIRGAEEYGYYIIKLNQSLHPGDSLHFKFEISHTERGFKSEGRENNIIPNGSFFSNDLLPYFGYDDSFILADNKKRRKSGLKEKTFKSEDYYC
jgi:hypothetical protein